MKNLIYAGLWILLAAAAGGAVYVHRLEMERLRNLQTGARNRLQERELAWRIFRLSENYRSGCRLLLREYQEEQAKMIGSCLQRSRRALPGVLAELGGTKNSLDMMYRLILDAARGTGRFRECCAGRLEPVTGPALQAEARMTENFRLLDHRLQERRRQYLADLAVFQQEKQFVPAGEELTGKLSGELEIQKLVSARMGTMFSVALEGMFIRDTWRILNAFFVRGTAAAGCAAADGPMPFGDMVGLGLTVWGLGETAWDIHQASIVLPEQLKKTLEARLRAAELGMLHRMERNSNALTELYLQQSRRIEALLQKKLKEK